MQAATEAGLTSSTKSLKNYSAHEAIQVYIDELTLEGDMRKATNDKLAHDDTPIYHDGLAHDARAHDAQSALTQSQLKEMLSRILADDLSLR